jgi:hypothetical protein
MNSLQRTVLVALGLGASYSLSYFGCQYLGTGIWGFISLLLVLFMAFNGGPPGGSA